MPATTSLLLCLLLLLSTAVAASLRSHGNNSTEFIRSRCAATLYPRLCFSSLAPYANQVQNDSIELARVATTITLPHLRSLSSHVAALRRAAKVGSNEAAALRDCSEVLGDAADLAGQTVAELKLLEEAGGANLKWRVANAETWMSAALTNEGTCVDGFDEVGGGAVKADVSRRVQAVEEYTSNALALINGLVAGS